MNIDTLFASLFTVVTAATFVLLTVMTVNLPKEQDDRVVFNQMVSFKSIAICYGLMLIPAFYFAIHGLKYASVTTIMMASVAAFCLTRMSNRARAILVKRHYI